MTAAQSGLNHSLAYIVSPNAVDARLSLDILGESGIDGRAFATLAEAAGALSDLPGCLVMVEEALREDELSALNAALTRLPRWCDLPLLFVARDINAVLLMVTGALPQAGNVSFLERPLNPHSFSSAVGVALHASARQHELGELLEQRDQSIRARDEFLAMLAHELRNPLAPMRNAVYVMRRLKLEEPMLVQSTEVLERQITHVARLVDDLLDVARLERNKLVLQKARVDLNRVAAAALETCLHAAQARGHRIQAHFDPQALIVDGDPVRLEQVFANLLGNAIKFSPEPSEIVLETNAVGAMGHVSVRDRGAGFPPDLAEKLFEPFYQGTSTLARTTGGLGMGLAIVRRLVELHSGSVRAASAGPGQGARFTVALPLVSRTSESTVSEPQEPTTRPKRVVVIEDHPDIRDTLQTILLMWGHQVQLAPDGLAGLALVLRERPDVALIDIGLPGMNGYDIAREVRAAMPEAAIRLIAVTGYGQPSDLEMTRQAGFDAHLLKPVVPNVLQRMLG